MLYLLKNKIKDMDKVYVGDKLNLIYRFKGVFFVMMGFCVFNRQKTISIYTKKKNFYLFFSILLINLRIIYKFDTFFFNSIKWKKLYRSNSSITLI